MQAFAREPGAAPIPVVLRGSGFQLNVWRALLTIPEGAACSYGSIAQSIGAPDAARAVGSAVGDNRIAYLIPCHRVIRATCDFGDYAWGAARKRAMLARESALAIAG